MRLGLVVTVASVYIPVRLWVRSSVRPVCVCVSISFVCCFKDLVQNSLNIFVYSVLQTRIALKKFSGKGYYKSVYWSCRMHFKCNKSIQSNICIPKQWFDMSVCCWFHQLISFSWLFEFNFKISIILFKDSFCISMVTTCFTIWPLNINIYSLNLIFSLVITNKYLSVTSKWLYGNWSSK